MASSGHYTSKNIANDSSSTYVPYLHDEFTSRDIMGVVRGACKKCDVGVCRRYIKATKDYTARPGDGRKHPSNDVGIMRCSRCGCMADDHEKDEAETCKEEGNTAMQQGKIELALQLYTRAIDIAPWQASYVNNASEHASLTCLPTNSIIMECTLSSNLG